MKFCAKLLHWRQAGPEEEVFVELPMGALIAERATDGEGGHFQPRVFVGFSKNYTDVYPLVN